jgi:hypothetical protein
MLQQGMVEMANGTAAAAATETGRSLHKLPLPLGIAPVCFLPLSHETHADARCHGSRRHCCLLSWLSLLNKAHRQPGQCCLATPLWTIGLSQAASLASRHAAASAPAGGAPQQSPQQPPTQPPPTTYGAQGSSAAYGSYRAQAGGATKQQAPPQQPPTSYGQQGSSAAYGGASGQCCSHEKLSRNTAGDACKTSPRIDRACSNSSFSLAAQQRRAGFDPGPLCALS